MKDVLFQTNLPGNLRYQPKALVPIFGYDYLYRAIADAAETFINSHK